MVQALQTASSSQLVKNCPCFHCSHAIRARVRRQCCGTGSVVCVLVCVLLCGVCSVVCVLFCGVSSVVCVLWCVFRCVGGELRALRVHTGVGL